MKHPHLIATAALIALLGCSEKERPLAEPAPLPAPAAPAAQPPAAPNVPLDPSADELPVPEDFEPEAEAVITAANYREELDKLEREIAAAQR